MADVKVRYIGDTTSLDKATKKTQQNLKGVEKASGSAAKSFSGLDVGAGIAAAGIGLVAVGLKGAIDEAQQSEKATKQTEAALRSTGGAAHVSAGQISELANSISLKSGIDDEAIQSGENLLLTFTNVRNEVGKGNDIFNQATQTITDMSVALGQDFKSSAIQVGKALNDPIKGMTALQRVGVAFTQQQKDQVKALVQSGDRLTAQKIILKELTTEFGGSAAAQATSIDKLTVSFKNLEESAGRLLLPALNDNVQILTDLTGAAGGAADGQSKFSSAIQATTRYTTALATGGLSELARHFFHHEKSAGAAGEATKKLDDAIVKLADDTASGANQDVLAEDSRKVTEAQGSQLNIQNAVTTAVNQGTDAQKAAAKAADDRAKKELNLRDAILGSANADLGYEQAVLGVGKALEEAKDGSRSHTDVLNDERSAILDVAGAAEKQLQAQYEANGVEASARDIAIAQKRALDELKFRYPKLTGLIDLYIQKLRLIPERVNTEVSLNATLRRVGETIGSHPSSSSGAVRTTSIGPTVVVNIHNPSGNGREIATQLVGALQSGHGASELRRVLGVG